VTVLFCDLTGSTELGETLDPERLRRLLASYFERMKAIVERHGGSVEKFIGDAVMAVFGVPVLHEDDAARAVRAAAEMRDELPDLGLTGRIGVMTGEVVTGTDERLATGDAVNVAARLEQAAQPGEVLIGELTFSLVRDAADVEPMEPLDVKGKLAPVPAYRLLRVHDAPERRRGKHFVGRDRELAILQEAWGRVRAERRCTLVTIVGDAGVGKSRLASELLASIETSVLRGRCLPYGEGITYWPVVEVLKQLPVLPPDEAAARAIRSLLGEKEVATSAEEIAWGFRKTLEHAAAERPMVIVFDDIHWGEETFLNLIEHVALLSSGASILLLCMARPELGEHHPTWPVTLRLEPLRDEDVDELIPRQIPLGLRERIARAAGGNPLYVEEMLSMAGEADDEVIVPPTLQALLAARLDQLGTAERRILERGAIEGEIFHRGAVQALAPEETQVTPRLAALVRKDLISPDTPMLLGDDGFRFRHLLIRDAAYDALPKAARADLHERFASWLEEHGTELAEALIWTGRSDEALRRAESLVERASQAGAIGSESIAEGCRPASSGFTSGRRARRASSPRSSRNRCLCSKTLATTWLSTSVGPRSLRWRRHARLWTRRWRLSSVPSPTPVGRATSQRLPWVHAPPVTSSARPLCRDCSDGSMRTSHGRGGITSSVLTEPGHWGCSADSTRRVRSSPTHGRRLRSAARASCSRTSPPSRP
jgi:class 3 adenylate cyclase